MIHVIPRINLSSSNLCSSFVYDVGIIRIMQYAMVMIIKIVKQSYGNDICYDDKYD